MSRISEDQRLLLIATLKAFKPAVVYVFGSFGTPSQHQGSDIWQRHHDAQKKERRSGPAALRNRQATHLDADLTEPEHNQLRIHSVISHSGPSERGAPAGQEAPHR